MMLRVKSGTYARGNLNRLVPTTCSWSGLTNRIGALDYSTRAPQNRLDRTALVGRCPLMHSWRQGIEFCENLGRSSTVNQKHSCVPAFLRELCSYQSRITC